MTKRMLIDSTHPEETRVVVLDGNRLDEFDLETSTKHQLKGNIYLAKIVRVEPSLQAAFVEYGGNRHGFLAFGEIHPDYYQIPIADRKRLLEAQEQEAREEEEQAERDDARGSETIEPETGEPAALEHPALEPQTLDTEPFDPAMVEPDGTGSEPDHEAEPLPERDTLAEPDPTGLDPLPEPERVAQPAAIAQDLIVAAEDAAALFPSEPADAVESEVAPEAASDLSHEHAEDALPPEVAPEAGEDVPAPEQIGGEHDTEEHTERRASSRFLRHYKIQEVIRRRQILLIQVVKEERGSKGAALTTYISLAGRFSVLMPNSPRGGGISRKITSAADRRRLKEVTTELDLPRGMGLIVRTAGANRPKPEILRDCEYLLEQWDQIRELTMKSMAPALIYEEASLIKRAIRDVYSRDVDEILVDGEQGWRAARDFMRMLMPTHARKVQLWKDPQPLFAKASVEAQLEGMLAPMVQLKSGGYLVINQTEALVAIDVNSGRSTRERGIEETALKTNLEAAEEAARQLRLRDLAGLIVIDFIDMESRRNVGAVERKLKDALKFDRARIQVGAISHFGLLEMSRQRLRPSLTETNFVVCPHCGGSGHVRSTESAALAALRAIEEEGGKRRAAEIVVHCASAVALYILNYKRQRLAEVETRHAMVVTFVADPALLPPALRIERVRAQTVSDAPAPVQQLAPPEPFDDPDEIEMEADEPEDPAVVAEAASASETGEERERRGRGRRRRRRGSRDDAAAAETAADPAVEGAVPAADAAISTEDAAMSSADAPMVPPADAAIPLGAETPELPPTDETGETASDGAEAGSAAAEDSERRRRGRRGGRRRRREPGEDAAAPVATVPIVQAPPPAYVGPTPADPFAGGNAFDIFDEIEQAEEERAAAARRTAPVSPVRVEPVDAAAPPEPEPAAPEIGVEAGSALGTEATPAPEPEPEPEPESIGAALLQPEPEPEPQQAAEPVAGPAIQPVLISDAPPERRRGWWRR